MTVSTMPTADPVSVSLGGLVRAELLKMKGSKIVWLSLGVPGVALLLASVAVLFQPTQAEAFMAGGSALFGFLMLPLGIMVLTVMLGQIEHQPRAWDPLLSLPGARRRIFILKLVAAAIVVAGWVLLYAAGLLALVAIFKALLPDNMTGSALPADKFFLLMIRMWAASLLMLVIQYGLALFFRGVFAPFIIGMVGIVFAVGATGSEYGIYFPWLLPLSQLASEDANADLALTIGLVGAAIGAMIVQWAMARREW